VSPKFYRRSPSLAPAKVWKFEPAQSPQSSRSNS
jgi:hypothetical protein